MYSYYGKTRYAFVITSTTLTVLRYSFISKDSGKLRLGVEYKAIPLSAEGSQLTATKAIVALAVMSMHEKQRDVVPKNEIMPINTWCRYEAGNSVIYAHLSTERLERSLPDSGRVAPESSASKLLTYRCYQKMRTAVGIPTGASSGQGSRKLEYKTLEEAIVPEGRDRLKVARNPQGKVRKSKPTKLTSIVFRVNGSDVEAKLSPRSLGDLAATLAKRARRSETTGKYKDLLTDYCQLLLEEERR